MVGCLENLPICKASCCRSISFNVNKLSPDLKYYYELHNCKIVKFNNDVDTVVIPLKCSQLDDNNLCKLHESGKKPKVCTSLDENSSKGCYLTEGCIYGKKKITRDKCRGVKNVVRRSEEQ